MRIRVAALVAGVVLVAACGGGEGGSSPREACIDAEATLNMAARECDPQFTGNIDLSCQNFGTGSSCGVIDAYFDCLVQTSCDNGTLILPTNCQLGACE
jgi:hypothetical protein